MSASPTTHLVRVSSRGMGEQPGIGEAASRAAVGHGLILYNVDCGFCRWSVAKVLAWDRRAKLGVLPIQSPEGARILAALDRPAQFASWHFLTADGDLRSGGAVFAPVLRLLPGGAALAALAAARPDATMRAYRAVASRRAAFGSLISAAAKGRADERIARRRRAPVPVRPAGSGFDRSPA